MHFFTTPDLGDDAGYCLISMRCWHWLMASTWCISPERGVPSSQTDDELQGSARNTCEMLNLGLT